MAGPLRQRVAGGSLSLPLIVLVLLIGIAPFGEAVVTSFFHDVYGQRSPAGLENYRYLFADQGFFYSLKISFAWAFLNTLISLAAGLLLAWKLHRSSRIQSPLYLSLLVPWGIPVYIAVPLWRSFFHGDGGFSLFYRLTGIEVNLLTDPVASFLCALWVSLWMTLPLTAFLLWGSMRKIPKIMDEAARLDGAGETEVFRWIHLPQIRGTLLAAGIVSFVKSLKEFNIVFLMTSGGPPLVSGITNRHIIGATTTLDLLLYEVFQTTEDLGITSAYAVCLAVVVVLAMLFRQLFRQKSLSAVGPALMACAGQILLGGPSGLFWGAGYLAVGLGASPLFPWLLSVQAVFMIFRIASQGFFAGFSPGILFALISCYLLLSRKSPRRSWPKPVQKPVTGPLPRLLPRVFQISLSAVSLLFILAALLMGFLLLWLSFSGLGTSAVDSIFPPFATGRNYVTIIAEERIFRYFLNTLLVAGTAGLLLPFIVLPAAQHLLQRGRRLAFLVLTALQIISLSGGMHTLVPLYVLFRRFQLIGTYVPLILIALHQSLSTGLLVSIAYLEKIPASFREAARLEGAGPWQYFRMVFLPVSLPAAFTNTILAFLAGWNSFMAPLLFLNREESFTISVKLFSILGNLASGRPRWNLFATASVLNCLLIGLLFYRFRNPLQTTPLAEYESPD